MILIGMSSFDGSPFRSVSPPIRNINDLILKNAIIDAVKIDATTSIQTSSADKEDWGVSTRMLTDFVNTLQAGNVFSSPGLEIITLNIKRRRIDELTDLLVGSVDFVNNSEMEFDDYTCPSGDYIYSVVPVLQNSLQGIPTSIEVTSDFVGWYIVDKNSTPVNVLACDKYIDSEPSVNTQLNQGRTVIETLNRFAHVYYDQRRSESFSLSAILIGDEFKKSGVKYQEFLDNFINPHKSLLVKSGDGRVYICDIFSPQASSPMNTWNTSDGNRREYITVQMNLLEIGTLEDYLAGEV